MEWKITSVCSSQKNNEGVPNLVLVESLRLVLV